MKWLKVPAVILFLVAALYFAYIRFETSFNPRRGQGPGGPPPMTPMMQKMMAKHNAKGAAARTDSKKSGARAASHASSPNPGIDTKKPAKGGD